MMRMRVPNSILQAAPLAAALLLATPAAAKIYRCIESGDDGPVTVYSDRPCDPEARVHHAADANLSVIAASEDLDRVAERNRDFVDARNQALERARERAAREARQAAAQRAATERLARRYDDDRFHNTLPHRFPVHGTRRSDPAGTRTADQPPSDPRVRQRAESGRAATDRGTLLSRSGGNRRILQR